ncbi:MAG: hypothetical protein EBS73_12610 [Betaproteobacteria bacterium]|nr:hypothetical protein [Betaproteobacteria bacterium]
MKQPIVFREHSHLSPTIASRAGLLGLIRQGLLLLLTALLWQAASAQAQSLEQTRRIMQSVVALQVSADPESPSSRSLGTISSGAYPQVWRPTTLPAALVSSKHWCP